MTKHVVFDCPTHGLEREIFCYEARDPKNKNRWHSEERELSASPLSDDEFNVIVERWDWLKKGINR